MKRITILYIIISQVIILNAQNYELSWQRCYGGSNDDAAYDMINVDNGYMIVGGTGSNNGDISYNHGGGDGWLVRIDTNGNILWERTYGGSNGDWFDKIVPANNNTFYLLGISWSSDGDISNDPYPDSPDIWIVKVDSIGNIIWYKILGTPYGDYFWNAAITLDDGVLVSGGVSGPGGDVSTFYGGDDSWYSKISSDGDIEWDYTIGTDWADQGMAAIQTSDGGYLLSSTSIFLSNDSSGNITCTPHSYGWNEGVLFKLDSSLNIQWQRCYGGSDSDLLPNILEVEDGYIFAGSTQSNDGDVSGWHPGYNHLGYPNSDIWIVKIDYEGNIIWQNCYGGSGGEYAKTIIPNEDNGFSVFGSTRSYDGDVSGNHGSSEYEDDIWMIKINNEGELLSQRCIGGARTEIVDFGAIKKTDYDFIVAGQTNYGPSYDVHCTPHGQENYHLDEDYWVFELKDCFYYAPAVPATPCGADTVCSAENAQTVYSTQPAENAQTYEWLLQPPEAGTITGDSLLGTVSWAENYEGTATVVVRSENDCGESEWSEPKYTQVYTCLGTEETETGNAALQVYPNPAGEFVVFALVTPRPPEGGEPRTVQIFDVYGRQVARLPLNNEKTVWDCSAVPNGLYLYTMELNGKILSGKIVIRK